MNAARTWTAVSWVPDGRLFAVGGLGDDREPVTSVEMLQCAWDAEVTTQSKWQPVAPLNHPRAAHGVALISGRLVAAGWKNTNTIEYFKLPCEAEPFGQWTVIRPMTRPLSLRALVPFKGALLAVGKGAFGSATELRIKHWLLTFRQEVTLFSIQLGFLSYTPWQPVMGLLNPSLRKQFPLSINDCHNQL